MPLLFNLLLILFTYSCAAKKIIVKNADTLINYKIEKGLHLNSPQKMGLERDIDQFLNNNKPLALEVKQLTENIDLTSNMRIEEKFKKGEEITKKVSDEVSVILSRYMSQLDKKQQALFFEDLKSENEEMRNKTKEERFEEVTERLESFIGSIKELQQSVLNEFRDYYELRSQGRLIRRIALHEKFKTIYAQSSGTESKQLLFQEAFKQYQKESFENNRTLEFMQRVLPTLDNGQKKVFLEKIADFQEIIDLYINTQY